MAYSQSESSVNSINSQVLNSLENEEVENQQINKDEGYGPNDEEYYNAEGVNAEDP